MSTDNKEPTMTEEQLRLEAWRMASQTRPDDVAAEAERIMRFLRPEPKQLKARKAYGTIRDDLPDFIALLESGKSRHAAGKALGYKDACSLINAASRYGVELPPVDTNNARVRHGLRMVSIMQAARRSA